MWHRIDWLSVLRLAFAWSLLLLTGCATVLPHSQPLPEAFVETELSCGSLPPAGSAVSLFVPMDILVRRGNRSSVSVPSERDRAEAERELVLALSSQAEEIGWKFAPHSTPALSSSSFSQLYPHPWITAGRLPPCGEPLTDHPEMLAGEFDGLVMMVAARANVLGTGAALTSLVAAGLLPGVMLLQVGSRHLAEELMGDETRRRFAMERLEKNFLTLGIADVDRGEWVWVQAIPIGELRNLGDGMRTRRLVRAALKPKDCTAAETC